MIRKLLFVAMVFFYLVAGINHFVMPEFYYPLIPDYLPFKAFFNSISGFLEILFAVGLIFPHTRKWSAVAITFLLLAFIPSHVYFIAEGGCIPFSLCVPKWLAWVRLVVFHPLLIYWAWYLKDFQWVNNSI